MSFVDSTRSAPPADAWSDLALGDAEFGRVQALIRRLAGIHLVASKKSMVQSRLAKRVQAGGHAGFAAYLDALERAGDASPERQQFVNALTTNLTSFFRESYHFPVLAETLRAVAASRRAPTVWCCAASTGEEPWSIAMTGVEALGESGGLRIHATDIDTNVLTIAQRGVYPLEAVKDLDAGRLRRFFLKGVGANAGKVRIQPALARMVTFAPLNLIADRPPGEEPFDVIFCRNVMIYFDRQVQEQVLRRLHAALRPGGMLFVGHSENFSAYRDLFVLQGKTVYRRAD